MSKNTRPALIILSGLLMLALVGCQLQGAAPAPLTPVGLDPIPTETPTQDPLLLLPSPTTLGGIDVFATQTAQAALPTTDPALTPTGDSIIPTFTATPDPLLSPTPDPLALPTATPLTAIATPGPAAAATATPAATTASGTVSLPADCRYTIQAGDTLFSIARRFGVSQSALAAANNITDPASIRAGDVLVIPGCTPAGGQPAGTPGASGDILYTVRAGDTLYSIARQYNTTAARLAEYNNLEDANDIEVGQVIRIPANR